MAKRLSVNLNFSFLNRISLLLIQIATQLSSQGWVDPVPDPILSEKCLGYSRESNTGPLGWQSDVLTTIPNRWSIYILSSECSQRQVLHCKRRNKPRLQFCRRQVFHRKLRNQGSSFTRDLIGAVAFRCFPQYIYIYICITFYKILNFI